MPKWVIVGLLFASIAPTTAAQRGGSFGFGGLRNGGFGGHHGRSGSLVFFGDPFLDADYAARTYQPPSPPVVIVQPTTVAAPTPAEPKADPLLIEWQGDRYVRYSGQHQSPSNVSLDYSQAPELSGVHASRAFTQTGDSRPGHRGKSAQQEECLARTAIVRRCGSVPQWSSAVFIMSLFVV